MKSARYLPSLYLLDQTSSKAMGKECVELQRKAQVEADAIAESLGANACQFRPTLPSRFRRAVMP